ncbi:MAG: PKD domain-containing protein [Flavobacteriales bacterium]|nr:PKD domain-containing protein [Flavobacteriales bacterium]
MRKIYTIAFLFIGLIAYGQQPSSPPNIMGETTLGPQQRAFSMATCTTDTVEYPLAKTITAEAVTMNVPSEFSGYAQYYDAPQSVTVSGFDFFAGLNTVTPGVSDTVFCRMIAANPDSTMGTVLADTFVIVDNSYNVASFETTMRREVIFPSAVTVSEPYFIQIETNSTGPMGVMINSNTSGDGDQEYLMWWHWTGDDNWYVSNEFFAWDVDVLLHPFVSYDLELGYEVSAINSCLGDSTCITDTLVSPIIYNRMYNSAVFAGTAADPITRNWGDGTSGGAVDTCHTYTAGGQYNLDVILNHTGWNMVCKDTASVQINVAVGNVVASFNNNVTGLSVDFTDMSTDFPNTWAWDFGDGNISTTQNPSNAFTAAGIYNICLIASSSCSTPDTTCQMIEVGCAQPTANFSAADTLLVVDFTDLTVNGNYWLWDFGDGAISTQQSPSHTYPTPGNYTICLVAFDSCYSDTLCMTIAVGCVQPTADFGVSVVDFDVDFTDMSLDATSWNWDFGTGDTSSLQNPSYTFPAVGTYWVCLITSNACYSDTVCDSVTINCPVLTADFTFILSTDGQTMDFLDNSTGNATSWSWNFGDGNSDIGDSVQNVYAVAGSYNVCLTISDGCSSDTVCQIVLATVGLTEYGLQGEMNVYPNPATSLLTIGIDLVDVDDLKLEILDATGRLVMVKNLGSIRHTQTTININDLAQGGYIIRIIGSRGQLLHRFVKR